MVGITTTPRLAATHHDGGCTNSWYEMGVARSETTSAPNSALSGMRVHMAHAHQGKKQESLARPPTRLLTSVKRTTTAARTCRCYKPLLCSRRRITTAFIASTAVTLAPIGLSRASTRKATRRQAHSAARTHGMKAHVVQATACSVVAATAAAARNASYTIRYRRCSSDDGVLGSGSGVSTDARRTFEHRDQLNTANRWATRLRSLAFTH